MPRVHGPLFDKLMPHRGWHRWAEDKIVQTLLTYSEISPTNSYDGIPCREWQRATRGDYGVMWNGRERVGTHVEAHKVFKGPVPEGHQVLHHCDNPPCIEARHLWTGTEADNMADRDRKGRNGAHKTKGKPRGPSKLRGGKHPNSVLTEAKARRIVKLKAAKTEDIPKHLRRPKGGLNVSALSRELGVSEALVRGVIAGRNWGWLE